MHCVRRDWGLSRLQRNQQRWPVHQMRRNGEMPELHRHGPRPVQAWGLETVTLERTSYLRKIEVS